MGLVSNHKSAEKEDLAQWVSLAWKRTLTHDNIKVGFLATWIWPFNLHAMDFRLRPSLSFHLGLDGLDGENNGNDMKATIAITNKKMKTSRLKKFKKTLMQMQMKPIGTIMSMILLTHLKTMWRMQHLKILPIQG